MIEDNKKDISKGQCILSKPKIKRETNISFKVNMLEENYIRGLAKYNQMRLSDYIRSVLMAQKV